MATHFPQRGLSLFFTFARRAKPLAKLAGGLVRSKDTLCQMGITDLQRNKLVNK